MIYKDILRRILESLCHSGAVFCHPEESRRPADERIMDAVVPQRDKNSNFDEDIPGSSYFSPAAGEGIPYYPAEKHSSHVEIVAAIAGSPDFFINSEWMTLEEGRVYVLCRNTVHTERHRGEDYTLYWLSCLPDIMTLHRTSYSKVAGCYSQSACRLAVSAPMIRMLWECAADARIDECHFFSLLVQSLDYAKCRTADDSDNGKYNISVLAQIKTYIDENYFLPVTLADLAEMARWSTVHLCRCFAENYGIGIHKYIVHKRVEAAAEMLAQGTAPAKAACNAGFSDPRYFSKVFKGYKGMTPSEFAAGMRKRS